MEKLINFNTINLIQEIDSTYMISINSSSVNSSFVGCFVDFNNIFCIEYISSQDNFEMKNLPIFDSTGKDCKNNIFFNIKVIKWERIFEK